MVTQRVAMKRPPVVQETPTANEAMAKYGVRAGWSFLVPRRRGWAKPPEDVEPVSAIARVRSRLGRRNRSSAPFLSRAPIMMPTGKRQSIFTASTGT
jgi:hypothetical protein